MQHREQPRWHRDRTCRRDNRTMQVAIGLHVLTLLAVVWLLLSSCGTGVAPSGYVWTDRSELVYLSWTNHQGKLSGTSTSVSYAHTDFPASTSPEVSTLGYTGTLSGTVVSLHLATLFAPTLSGTQSGDGQTLTLNVPAPTTGGQLRLTTWIAVTPAQENALVAAFKAHEVIHGMLPIVGQDASAEPTPWTDQNRGYIAQVQRAVQADQQMLTTIQQAHDETTQCQDVQIFQASNLLTIAVFRFVPVPADAALLTHLATLAHAWTQVHTFSVPQIAGLSAVTLLWVVSPAEYQAGTRTAMHLAEQITSSEQQDKRQLQALLQQYQRIIHTEQAIASSCLGA